MNRRVVGRVTPCAPSFAGRTCHQRAEDCPLAISSLTQVTRMLRIASDLGHLVCGLDKRHTTPTASQVLDFEAALAKANGKT